LARNIAGWPDRRYDLGRSRNRYFDEEDITRYEDDYGRAQNKKKENKSRRSDQNAPEVGIPTESVGKKIIKSRSKKELYRKKLQK